VFVPRVVDGAGVSSTAPHIIWEISDGWLVQRTDDQGKETEDRQESQDYIFWQSKIIEGEVAGGAGGCNKPLTREGKTHDMVEQISNNVGVGNAAEFGLWPDSLELQRELAR
jgi:hypothetical protein